MFEADHGTKDTKLLFSLELGTMRKNSAEKPVKYVHHLSPISPSFVFSVTSDQMKLHIVKQLHIYLI
jgi:hypothetical protein